MDDLSMVNLQPGEQIGGYTLIAPLGGGAMGSVWKVRDDGGQLHAMKILRDSLNDERSLVSTTVDRFAASGTSETVTARERLRREAMALQRVHHPGVCEIVDMELDDALAFIVTELIEGNNLRDDIAENGRYIGDDLERLASKLMDAVHAVHHAGIVHRDIKPTNVMIAATGPILVDFGIAMGEGESHVTRTGLVMGTPGFIAPEIIDGAESSALTDWWSVSAVLAYAATGKAVFGTRPMMTVLEREASGNADLSGLPDRTQAAFRQALSPNPEERCTPDELLHAITVDALAPQLWNQAIENQESSTALLGKNPNAEIIDKDSRLHHAPDPLQNQSPENPSDQASGTQMMRPFGIASLADGQHDDESPAIAPTAALGDLPADSSPYETNPRTLWGMNGAESDRYRADGDPAPVGYGEGYQADEPGGPYEEPYEKPLDADGDPWQSNLTDTQPDVPERERDLYQHRGSIVLMAIAAFVTPMFALLPIYAFMISCLGLWICVCMGMATDAQLNREERRGGFRNRSDVLVALTTMPWHVARSFIVMVSRALVQIIMLTIVIGLSTVALSLPTTRHTMQLGTLTFRIPLPSDSAVSATGLIIAGGMLLAWIITTAGPLSGTIRLGAGRLRGRYLHIDERDSPNEHGYDRDDAIRYDSAQDLQTAHDAFSPIASRVLFFVWIAAFAAVLAALAGSPAIDWNPLQAVY
ncbi:serine/threonine-protein kinase [Bifidobacterium sp.]|uniref:serine/threonine-protein kinase n=1 Tax=Bifidobacterium sp. TaxID=41200 RepID=UPI0039EB398D